jgi:hypothetical protein
MLGRPWTADLADGENRILPPPGRWRILLRGKNGEEEATEIQIEKGTIRLSKESAGKKWEYAEFSSTP